MKRKRLIGAVSAAVFFPLLFAACITDSNMHTNTTPIIVRGTAFEMDSTTVIPGVTVQLIGSGRRITDASGYYIFDDIPYYMLDSSVLISASKDGYENWRTSLFLWQRRVTKNIYMSAADSTN